jgi:hypothetical protein
MAYLSDAEWGLIKKVLDPASKRGNGHKHSKKSIVDAISKDFEILPAIAENMIRIVMLKITLAKMRFLFCKTASEEAPIYEQDDIFGNIWTDK